jgi:hypothetical protein
VLTRQEGKELAMHWIFNIYTLIGFFVGLVLLIIFLGLDKYLDDSSPMDVYYEDIISGKRRKETNRDIWESTLRNSRLGCSCETVMLATIGFIALLSLVLTWFLTNKGYFVTGLFVGLLISVVVVIGFIGIKESLS